MIKIASITENQFNKLYRTIPGAIYCSFPEDKEASLYTVELAGEVGLCTIDGLDYDLIITYQGGAINLNKNDFANCIIM